MTEKHQLKLKLKKNNKMLIVLVPVLLVALFVCMYNFISLQVEISQKNNELAQITAERANVENDNQMLSRYSKEEYKIEYIESIARDKLGYALPEERIYYIVPAD